MKFGISAYVCFWVLGSNTSTLHEETLRSAALASGFVGASAVNLEFDSSYAEVGAKLFRSKLLSFNAGTSCSTCHLEEYGSSDGLGIAVGVGGHGRGPIRAKSGGQIVPRNTLPLWGRGGVGFNTFFWDGKIIGSGNELLSQFGMSPPSKDPLVVAMHLPVVELRELIRDTPEVREQIAKESVEGAKTILDSVAMRAYDDATIGPMLRVLGPSQPQRYLTIAKALAAFIRRDFQLRASRFERFVFEDGSLSSSEVRGGLIFFGKGRCSSCHYGPYFTDFRFHGLAVIRRGFGKNGFGVDYGRFNVSHDPDEVAQFRTPPLSNVQHTGPYGHSGAYESLAMMIRAHFDPLAFIEPAKMSLQQRHEFHAQLRTWAKSYPEHPPLTRGDVEQLVAFLKTLSFCAKGSSVSGYCPQPN